MQATSRNFPPANSARRGPGPGPVYAPAQAQAHSQALSAAQQGQANQEELRRRQAAQRAVRKLSDRNLPDDLSDVCIGDGAKRYRKLRDVERKLDSTMMQKRLDISEGLTANMKREGILRIWISNTAEGQPWQVLEEGGPGMENETFDFVNDSQATYRVKIEGRLLEDPDEADGENHKDGEKPMPTGRERTKLSHFFKSINVEFDRAPSLQPDGYSSIEWKKPSPTNMINTEPEANFDCLEFERKGDEEMNVTISLVREEHPERYKLSKPLADLLDTEEEDRAGVVAGVWEYVRAMGLQEDDENRKIACDEQLQRVFGMETLFFPHVPELVHNHLSPIPPLKLAYTIRVDRDYISPRADSSDGTTPPIPSAPTIYDIRVPLPSPLKQQMQRIHTSPSHLQNLQAITNIDEDIALLVQKIGNQNMKRKFYDSLARDPANFVKRWVASQKRDLEVILAEAGRGGGDEGYAGEEFRRGGQDGVWGGNLAREGVGLWLARQKPH